MSNINNIFNLYFSKEQIERIRKTKVLIIGCGGLGSNVSNILVRTGFINFTIIDFDKVELKNLNRQQFFTSDIGKNKVDVLKKNLLEINPELKIKSINKELDNKKLENIIKTYDPDVVIEAVDKEYTKTMIFETTLKMGKTLITASGVAGYGDVENIKIIRKRSYTLIGDLVSRCGCCNECYSYKGTECNIEKSLKKGEYKVPLAPKVIVVAAMQADEVLRRVLTGRTYEKKRKN